MVSLTLEVCPSSGVVATLDSLFEHNMVDGAPTFFGDIIVTRMSASHLKKGISAPPLQEKPREGTKIRKLYDYFVAHPLKPIHRSVILKVYDKEYSKFLTYSCIEKLLNYNLDIRKCNNKGYWWLVGYETDKGQYIDLLANALEKEGGNYHDD